MQSNLATLWGFSADRFHLAPNAARMEAIIADMKANGGALAPSAHWTLSDSETATMDSMLSAWVGSVGMLPLADPKQIDTVSGDPRIVPGLLAYLRALDARRLLPQGDTLAHLAANHYRVTDLHSLIDLFLLLAHLDNGTDEKIRVLEVGGGFGRLAEVLQRTYPGRVQHVLIDAVPSSLMYAEVYLKARFPHLSVVYAQSESFADVAEADIVILPSWRSDILPENLFDLCVNIESFQEMDRVHVAYYYDYFNTRSKPDGLIYITNSRDYVYKGPWETPANWEQLFKHRTPRSWTRNHPTEFFRRRTGDHRASQYLHEYYYQAELAAFDQSRQPAAATPPLPPAEGVPVSATCKLRRCLGGLKRHLISALSTLR